MIREKSLGSRQRRYTSEDQKIDYPNDKGLEFVAEIAEKEIVWGRSQAGSGGGGGGGGGGDEQPHGGQHR